MKKVLWLLTIGEISYIMYVYIKCCDGIIRRVRTTERERWV